MNTLYNTDLALYPQSASHTPAEERIPENLEAGHSYSFAKPGHRNYLPEVPVTLMEIKKDDILFDMKAQVQVVGTSFELRDGKAYTTGTYVVRELLND